MASTPCLTARQHAHHEVPPARPRRNIRPAFGLAAVIHATRAPLRRTPGSSLQAHQIALVRHSFALIRPRAARAAGLFFGHLFAAAPAMRPLFQDDLVHQGEHLMSWVGSTVRLLDEPDILVPLLRGLGKHHGARGVAEAHYATAGECLVLTLAQTLGDLCTPEIREAWREVYARISRTMISASLEATSVA